jgi:hypothetical protein
LPSADSAAAAAANRSFALWYIWKSLRLNTGCTPTAWQMYLLGKPHIAQAISAWTNSDVQSIVRIDNHSVGVAGPVRHPRSVIRDEQRLERCDQATGGLFHDDAPGATALMTKGRSIGYDDHATLPVLGRTVNSGAT